MRIIYLLPLLLFFFIAIVLWLGLGLHPTQVPSPLINKPAPSFTLPSLLENKDTSNNDFKGRITLVNVWATWCYACAEEHAYLVKLAKEGVNFYGLNYKDDAASAQAWLKQQGNPYQIVAVDKEGRVAIDWGVYGAPETFIVDKHGIIRYKQLGPITPETWKKTIKPLIDKLESAA